MLFRLSVGSVVLTGMVGLLAAGQGEAGKSDAAKEDLAKLQGEWTLISMEHGGQASPEAKVKTFTRKIEGNKYTITIKSGDEVTTAKGTITLDPAKKPKAVDVSTMDDEGNKVTLLGIYELKDDTHRVCLAANGTERPTEFATVEGDSRTLLTWKKVKSK